MQRCDDKMEMMDCNHMDMRKGGHHEALAMQRTPMRIIAAVTMAVGAVELGIGTFVFISKCYLSYTF